MHNQTWQGRCFEAAIHALRQNPRGVLVHGTPLGHAGEVAGIRYAHAWVELGDLLVVDLTMNGRPTMPRALYYCAASLIEEHVRRYTADEAVRLLRATGHYGPWDGPALTIAA